MRRHHIEGQRNHEPRIILRQFLSGQAITSNGSEIIFQLDLGVSFQVYLSCFSYDRPNESS